MTFQQKTPNALVRTPGTRPTLAQMLLREGAPMVRLVGWSTTRGELDNTVIVALVDPVTGGSYGVADTTTGAGQSSMIGASVNGVTLVDGRRPGNPDTNRRGYAIPASTVASKKCVSVMVVGRVPASVWTDYAPAASSVLLSYLFGPTNSGTAYLWRVRFTAGQIEAAGRRKSDGASAINVVLPLDTSQWFALIVSFNFETGTIEIENVLTGEVASGSGMLGSGTTSQAAGGSDILSIGYQFYSTGTAHGWYGQWSDLALWAGEPLTAWQRFAWRRHAKAMVRKLAGT